jgi:hypothetical protein
MTSIVVYRARKHAPGRIERVYAGLLLLYAEDDYQANPLSSWAPAGGMDTNHFAFAKAHATVTESVRAALKQGRTSGQADGFIWEPRRPIAAA